MNTTSTIATFFGVLVLGVLSLALLKSKRNGEDDSLTPDGVKLKRLLSDNELEFIGRLETACPELRFHAQVSMGAVLESSVPRNDRKVFMRIRSQFSQKIIDFVAQERESGEVVAIIELDDRTHSAEKDMKRDALLKSAGYRTVRWDSRNKPDAEGIRSQLTSSSRAKKVEQLRPIKVSHG